MTLIAMPVATCDTQAARAYVGSDELFDRLVADYALSPVHGQSGKKGCRWLYKRIDKALARAQADNAQSIADS